MQTHEVPREHYLDVCDRVPGFDETNEYDCIPMTLLAFAGYYGRKKMMDDLIENGARKCWHKLCHYAVIFSCL